ncbi:MAG: STAS domain-containing protein [Nitriliruptoraceae bacterium]
MPALRIVRQDGDGRARLIAVGKVDTETAPDLRQRLGEAQHDDVDVVLDLEGVEFLDSFGVGVIVEGARRARERGRRFVVISPSRRIAGVLFDAGIDRLATLIDDESSH